MDTRQSYDVTNVLWPWPVAGPCALSQSLAHAVPHTMSKPVPKINLFPYVGG